MYNELTYVNSSNAVLPFIVGLLMFGLVLVVIGLLLNYFLFKKLGLDGWRGLIPVYSSYLFIQTLTKSKKLALAYIILAFLSFIPILNYFFFIFLIAISVYTTFLLAKGFGKGIVFTILLFTPIGFLLLGYLAFSKKAVFDESLIEADRSRFDID